MFPYTSSSSVPKQWDILVSGAGPAGLTAAFFAARAGLSVLVCEQACRPGPRPRGETVRPDPIFGEVLGSEVMEGLAIYRTGLRRYYSPGAWKRFELERACASVVFEWDPFVEALRTRAQEAGAQFAFGRRVVAPWIEHSACTGVITGDGSRIRARTVLACDGHDSALGRAGGVSYGSMNCPIVKRLVEGFSGGYPGFEYFFIAQGQLEYAPRFPPAVAFVFPRGNGRCELGLMVFTSAARRLSERCDLPDDDEMLRVWAHLVETYPVLKDLVEGSTTTLEYVTCIPTARVHHRPMSLPGLALVGDAFGFVEASGASGIVSSMKQARFVVEYCRRNAASPWTRAAGARFEAAFRATVEYQRIRRVSRVIIPTLDLLFAGLRSSSRVNRHWGLVERFYRLT